MFQRWKNSSEKNIDFIRSILRYFLADFLSINDPPFVSLVPGGYDGISERIEKKVSKLCGRKIYLPLPFDEVELDARMNIVIPTDACITTNDPPESNITKESKDDQKGDDVPNPKVPQINPRVVDKFVDVASNFIQRHIKSDKKALFMTFTLHTRGDETLGTVALYNPSERYL